jgi:hypothetical protein
MIIEFIGLPGSGKSFYSNRLKILIEKESTSCDIYTRDTVDYSILKLLDYASFFWRTRYFSLVIMLALIFNIRYDIKKTYTLFLGVKETFKLYTYIYKNNKNSIYILDEGINQRLISIFFFNNFFFNKGLFKVSLKLLNNKSLPDYLVYIDRDIEQSLKQAKKRLNGLPYRFRNFKNSKLHTVFYNQISGFDMLLQQDKVNTIKLSDIKLSDIKLFLKKIR